MNPERAKAVNDILLFLGQSHRDALRHDQVLEGRRRGRQGHRLQQGVPAHVRQRGIRVQREAHERGREEVRLAYIRRKVVRSKSYMPDMRCSPNPPILIA